MAGFDLAEARKHYTEDEILDYLSKSHPSFNVKDALTHYSKGEIIDHLSTAPTVFNTGKRGVPTKPNAPGGGEPHTLGKAGKAYSEMLPAGNWPELFMDPSKLGDALWNTAQSIAAGPSRIWGELSNAGQSMLQGSIPGFAYHTAGTLPMLGPVTQQIGREVGEGKYQEALGHTGGLATMLASSKLDPEGSWFGGRAGFGGGGPVDLSLLPAVGKEAAKDAMVAAKGAVKGGWQGAKTPAKIPFVKVRIPFVKADLPGSLAYGAGGYYLGNKVAGVPGGVAGGMTGALVPIVKGAYKGARQAVRERNAPIVYEPSENIIHQPFLMGDYVDVAQGLGPAYPPLAPKQATSGIKVNPVTGKEATSGIKGKPVTGMRDVAPGTGPVRPPGAPREATSGIQGKPVTGVRDAAPGAGPSYPPLAPKEATSGIPVNPVTGVPDVAPGTGPAIPPGAPREATSGIKTKPFDQGELLDTGQGTGPATPPLSPKEATSGIKGKPFNQGDLLDTGQGTGPTTPPLAPREATSGIPANKATGVPNPPGSGTPITPPWIRRSFNDPAAAAAAARVVEEQRTSGMPKPPQATQPMTPPPAEATAAAEAAPAAETAPAAPQQPTRTLDQIQTEMSQSWQRLQDLIKQPKTPETELAINQEIATQQRLQQEPHLPPGAATEGATHTRIEHPPDMPQRYTGLIKDYGMKRAETTQANDLTVAKYLAHEARREQLGKVGGMTSEIRKAAKEAKEMKGGRAGGITPDEFLNMSNAEQDALTRMARPESRGLGKGGSQSRPRHQAASDIAETLREYYDKVGWPEKNQ